MSVTVQEGKYIDHVAGSNLAAGDVVVIGSLVGVAPRPIANGATGVVQIEGVVALPKLTSGDNSNTITAGALVYWYATSGVAMTAVTGVKAGYAIAQAVTGASTVNVKLER
jgi:predicted RecA/RadA family phage recombinase